MSTRVWGTSLSAGKHILPPHTDVLLNEYLALLKAAGGHVSDEALHVTEDDVLIVVDMQNDFHTPEEAPDGGRFGVPEGASASRNCIHLLHHFAASGAKIIASKDYHPKDHISFFSRNGPFPEHCLQGSPGAAFYPPIGDTLKELRSHKSHNVHIVHKGFHEDIDSFSVLPYKPEQLDDRPLCCADRSCCPLWTGGYELKCSNIDKDINAPPDILSILENRRIAMQTLLTDGAKGNPLERRLFICGLAMDFCCLDTVVNAAAAGYKNVFLITDATRAAHIPGIGKYGSGFLTDPAHMVRAFREGNIRMVTSAAVGVQLSQA